MRAVEKIIVRRGGNAAKSLLLLLAFIGTSLFGNPRSASAQPALPPHVDTATTTLREVCGRLHPQVCIDSMTFVPRDRAEVFREGGALAIDILMGDTLPRRLARALASMNRVAPGIEPRAKRPRPARFSRAWRSTSADVVVGALRQQLPTITLTTYDDCGLWRRSSNRAFEPEAAGPVRVNRCVEIPMTAPDIANTIAHETAHRAGYSHPHMGGWFRNWSLANCEPPYLVGSLTRSIAASTPITSTQNNCAYLIEERSLTPSR
jgi:hypothetical protein